MAPVVGVFPFWRIALDAGVAFLGSLLVALGLNRRSKSRAASAFDAKMVALVVSLSVLAWRSFATVAPLHNDPIPPVSPNDALSPIVTYVALGWYAAFHAPADAAGWARERALRAAVSFIVNVVGI